MSKNDCWFGAVKPRFMAGKSAQTEAKQGSRCPHCGVVVLWWRPSGLCGDCDAYAQGYHGKAAPESAPTVAAVDPHAGIQESRPRAPEELAKTGQEVPPVHRADTPILCPKCGWKGWAGPRYHDPTFHQVVNVDEPLILRAAGLWYTCILCGYERREPTKDAVPPTHTYVCGACGKQDTVKPTCSDCDEQAWRLTTRYLAMQKPKDTDVGLKLGPSLRLPASTGWWMLSILCALGWYLFIVQTIARMNP